MNCHDIDQSLEKSLSRHPEISSSRYPDIPKKSKKAPDKLAGSLFHVDA